MKTKKTRHLWKDTFKHQKIKQTKQWIIIVKNVASKQANHVQYNDVLHENF